MKNILIVDDMAIFRDPIAICLQHAGFKTTCAANGREALAAIHASTPDLILLDISMPEMDGITLLRNLSLQKPNKKIPVLLLTAMSDKKYIIDAAKLGVRGYLLKSRFSLEELLSRIHQCLNDSPQNAGGENSLENGSPKGTATVDKGTAGNSQVGSVPGAKSGAAATASKASPQLIKNVDNPVEAAADAAAKSESPPPAPTEIDANEVLAKSMGVKVLLTRDQCLERAEKALQGKALSGVVAQVIQIATMPGSDAAQLGESISHDPILSAKVLRVANSTAYASSRGPVNTVFDAIKKIGFSTVRNIAATVGIIEAMPAGKARDGFNPIRGWQHSFAVAMLAERLVSTSQKSNASAAAVGYLAGLCHDLGEILFQSCFGEEYRQVLEAQERTKHPISELEKVMLGIPSSELIKLTLRSLSLPDAILAPIEAMHAIQPTKDLLGSILNLADIYANGMLLASSPKSPLRGFTPGECERALASSVPPTLDREKIRAEIFALTLLLTQSADQDLTKPLFAPTKSAIWFAREPGLPKLDPVEVALESMAKVQSNNRLPTAAESNGVKAMVIEARDASMGAFSSQHITELQAQCKNKLKILWLVHKSEMAITPDGSVPQPVLMPATLDVVAKFVAAA